MYDIRMILLCLRALVQVEVFVCPMILHARPSPRIPRHTKRIYFGSDIVDDMCILKRILF